MVTSRKERNRQGEIDRQVIEILWASMAISHQKKYIAMWEGYRRAKDADRPTSDQVRLIGAMENDLLPAIISDAKQRIRVKALEDHWPEAKTEEVLGSVAEHFLPSEETIRKCREAVDIGCPVCRTRLVYIGRRQYETSNDHVSDPNGYVAKKDGYGCPNGGCSAHGHLSWLADGEGPYGTMFGDEHSFIDDNYYPFRTWHRKYEAEKEKHHEVVRLSWGKRRCALVLKHTCRADENGKRSWLHHDFRFQLILDGVYYTSGLQMLFSGLSRYYRCKWSREHMLKEHRRRIASWDRRWWSRLEYFIANAIWGRGLTEEQGTKIT